MSVNNNTNQGWMAPSTPASLEQHNEPFQTPPASPEQQYIELSQTPTDEMSIAKIEILSKDFSVIIKPENRSKLRKVIKDPDPDQDPEIKNRLCSIKDERYIGHIINQNHGSTYILFSDALRINKISNKTIFNFEKISEDDVAKFSLHPYQIEHLEKLIQNREKKGEEINKKIKNKIQEWKRNGIRTIKPDLAKSMDDCFKTKMFDFELILSQQEVKEQDTIKKPSDLPSSPETQRNTHKTKRTRNSESTEDLGESPLKKPRIEDGNSEPFNDAEQPLQPPSNIGYTVMGASSLSEIATYSDSNIKETTPSPTNSSQEIDGLYEVNLDASNIFNYSSMYENWDYQE